jgi:hypothetical protein
MKREQAPGLTPLSSFCNDPPTSGQAGIGSISVAIAPED